MARILGILQRKTREMPGRRLPGADRTPLSSLMVKWWHQDQSCSNKTTFSSNNIQMAVKLSCRQLIQLTTLWAAMSVSKRAHVKALNWGKMYLQWEMPITTKAHLQIQAKMVNVLASKDDLTIQRLIITSTRRSRINWTPSPRPRMAPWVGRLCSFTNLIKAIRGLWYLKIPRWLQGNQGLCCVRISNKSSISTTSFLPTSLLQIRTKMLPKWESKIKTSMVNKGSQLREPRVPSSQRVQAAVGRTTKRHSTSS